MTPADFSPSSRYALSTAPGMCLLTLGDVVVMRAATPTSWDPVRPAEPVPVASLLPPRGFGGFTRIDHGGDGEHTVFVCGFLRGDAVLFDPVLRALPELFVVQSTDPAATWMRASVDYTLATSRSRRTLRRSSTRVCPNCCSPRCCGSTYGRAATRSFGWLAPYATRWSARPRLAARGPRPRLDGGRPGEGRRPVLQHQPAQQRAERLVDQPQRHRGIMPDCR